MRENAAVLGLIPDSRAFDFHTSNVSYTRARRDARDSHFGERDTFEAHTFVVPRTMTTLSFSGTVVTANPTSVLLCNRYQRVQRRPISSIDAADLFTVRDELLFEIVREFDRNVSYAFPFQVTESAPPPNMLLEARVLADSITAGIITDGAAEEGILNLARSFVKAAYRNRRSAIACQRELDGIEAVREWIVRHPAQNASLAELADLGGVTLPRLCRLFRSRTGLTVTRFRHVLRMCLALELMSGSGELFDIALLLGYSSHSHFTFVFRKIFGLAPSIARKRLVHGDPVVRAAVEGI